MNECKVIHKQTYDKELNSVIFDSISGFTSIYFMMDQITYVIHLLHYNIYLVYKFQPAIMNECKVIHKQTYDKDSNFVIFDHFDSNSRLIQFIFMMDQITYVIHQLHYYIYHVYKFQPAIMNECKVIHKQPPIRTQILSFLTILTVIPD